MTELENAEIKERVREAVQNFINTVADDVVSEGYRIPKKDVVRDEEIKSKVDQVPVPRELITLYSSRQDEFFRDAADWLVSSGNRFPEPNYEEGVPTAIIGNPDNLPSKRERRVAHHENVIFNFAGDVLNYVGDVEFDEEAFNVAFENEFLPNYRTDLRSYEIVVPLLNFTGPSGFDSDVDVLLEGGIEIHHGHTYHRVESISLSTLSKATASGLSTFEYNYRQRNPSDLIQPGQWAIHAEVKSSTDGSTDHQMTDTPGKQLGKRIVTALRLFRPTDGSVGFQRAFEISPGWQMYRLGIPAVLDIDEGRREPPLEREYYTLEDAEQEAFQELWSQLCGEIKLDPEYEMSTALRRFNEMYVKPYPGDRLLDCMIACEGLLLRGPHPGTKTSRMSLRASLLLDDFAGVERQETRNRIKTAYERRGKLVHQDEYLADILNPDADRDSESFVHPAEYLTELRELLANVVLAYLMTTNNGHTVSEVNESIDSTLRDAPFSLEG